MGECVECGTSFERGKHGPPRRTCSRSCHARAARVKRKAAAKIACANPFCNGVVPYMQKRYCSPECRSIGALYYTDRGAAEARAISLGLLSACRIYTYVCDDCGEPVVRQHRRNSVAIYCLPCVTVRRNAHSTRKNHRRRAAKGAVLTVQQIADRDGNRCHICGKSVDMSRSGLAKWGPTIDHLVPVSHGGTNDPGNLALAHRQCNTVRGNRGPAQLRLVG